MKNHISSVHEEEKPFKYNISNNKLTENCDDRALKFRYSEKATEVWKKSHFALTLPSNFF